MRRLLLLCGLALALLALTFRGSLQALASGIGTESRRLVGRPTPELPLGLRTIGSGGAGDGKTVRLAALRGRPVVLHFWTFGCINCKRMIPHYADWQARYASRGLAIVGVHTPELDWERDRARLAAFVAEQHIATPTVVDEDNAAWDRFFVEAWPTAIVIDPNGIVRGVFIGDDAAPAIERAFLPYLR